MVLPRSITLPLRFARRELRTGIKGFRIFLACLALGVAAIAAVGSVSSAMMAGLEGDARRLLGGDVDLRLVHRAADDAQRDFLAQSGQLSEIVSMRAMARRSDGEARSLIELKAVDNTYPLIGSIELAPAIELDAALAERDGVFGAVVEESLATRLDLEVGDHLKVGDATLELRAILMREPDRIVNFASFGPRLMLSEAALPATGLVQVGSLIRYHYRVVLHPGTNREAWLQELDTRFPDAGWRTRSLENAAPGFDTFVDRTTLFLSLVGLTALLVGGVGVAMAVKTYLDGKTETIATLKCLGAPSALVFRVYLLVVLILAGAGTMAGLIVGATAPLAASALAGSMLPFQLPVRIYPAPLLVAALYGLLTALAFSLWPLGRAGQVKAAALFRAVVAPLAGRPRAAFMLATAAAVALLAALAIATTPDRVFAAWFIAGSIGAFGLFLGAASLVMAAARRAGRPRDPELRIALANLHRPGAPTPGVVLALGLGLTVLIAVALIQANLVRQVTERIPDQAPAFFFIDIQPDQVDRFNEIVRAIPGVSEVRTTPMVRGRIAEVNGVDAEALTVDPDSAWALRGDRGLTYSATPPDGSEVVAGEWWAPDYAGPPLISFDARIAGDLGVGIGDTVTLNVLGRPITATIANLRRIDWSSMSMNFIFVFAPGTLEAAPHSVIATVRVDDPGTETTVQRRVTDALPNVTAIRVKDAIEAADRILRAVSTAVRATAAVTLLAGTLVLAGAIAAGHAGRVRDAVILKVLGATRVRILKAYALEYGILGLVTAAIAAVVGSVAAFVVVTRVMRADFVLAPEVVAIVAAIATAITLVFGFAGTWQALGQKPAPLLRNE
ncbi:FtsX-like permease family protein [Thalassobaculum sp.]|uniref:ABC transporter permease n=1 Tax=Thalassobaculum sp. TaxID=2022740 RepID=UPI0032EEB266